MASPPIDVLQMYVREAVGGPYCGGADEGRLLAEFLLKIWPRYRKIRVSFRGIDVVEFPFCWALARSLVRGVGPEGIAGKSGGEVAPGTCPLSLGQGAALRRPGWAALVPRPRGGALTGRGTGVNVPPLREKQDKEEGRP